MSNTFQKMEDILFLKYGDILFSEFWMPHIFSPEIKKKHYLIVLVPPHLWPNAALFLL